MAASLLMEKKHQVGLFTSPHLFDFTERIRVNGKMISEQEVVDFCEMIRNSEIDFKPSFFEITFVMAIRHFINQNCDYVVLETGMGGRLDATNVVKPLVSVITNIGLDHQQYLGNTLKDIATEKGGIIKDDTPLVIGKRQEEVYPIFEELASIKKAPIHIAQNDYNDDDLPKYQLENTKYSCYRFTENWCQMLCTKHQISDSESKRKHGLSKKNGNHQRKSKNYS